MLIARVLGQTHYVRTQQPYLTSRGVRYLISTHPTTKRRLLREPWLQLVWQERTLAIFELRGFSSPLGLPPALGQQVKTVRYDDAGRYELTFTQPVTIPANTTLAVSYHPWLHVTAEGQSVRTSRDGERRLTLRDTVGPTHTLTITYRPGPGAVISLMVSRLTGLAVLMLLLKRGEG